MRIRAADGGHNNFIEVGMSSRGFILSALSWLLTLSRRYDSISKDSERKARTVYFGVYSIITTLAVGGLFLLGIWGLTALIDASGAGDLSVILIWVLIAIVAIMELVLLAEYIFGGALGVFYQLRCNRRPIGWIALAIYLAATIGMIIGIIFIIGTLGL